ncbi:MAG TPA: GNAT family N-acetyltransferase [Stellaceae bacterium]
MSPAEVKIRRLLAEDAALYREIRLEALERDPDAFGSTFGEESAEPLQWFADQIADSTMLGAFDGDDLLGIVGFFTRHARKEAHKGVLWGMYVRPRARSGGLGKRLVEAVIDHARQCVEVVQLNVIRDNEPAHRLYARLGFVEYGLERNSLKQNGRYWDEVLMAKPLLSTEAPQP